MYVVPIIMIIISLINIQLETRPCISVSGEAVIIKPRWKKSQTIHVDDITSRRTSIKVALPAAGLAAFMITRCRGSNYIEIIYYKGKERLITID